jgi:hypothetical protein
MRNGMTKEAYNVEMDTRDDIYPSDSLGKFSLRLDEHEARPREINWLSLAPVHSPSEELSDIKIDLNFKGGDETLIGRLKLPSYPSASSFHTVNHVTPEDARLYSDLDSFIMRELNLTLVETAKIRRDFFAKISSTVKDGEELNLKENATILKGIILAAGKIGEALRKEMSSK